MDSFAPPDAPCLFCEETPRSGAWQKPCASSPDRLHWTASQWSDVHRERLEGVGASLRRAAYELEKVATRIDALPDRLKRKVIAHSVDLDPGIVRNEAERARDALHLNRLLDV